LEYAASNQNVSPHFSRLPIFALAPGEVCAAYRNKIMVNQEPFYYRSVGSYCPLSSHAFAEHLAADIYKAVGDEFVGGTLEIEIYTPPYKPALTNEKAAGGGTLVLHITSARQENAPPIGAEFGRLSKNRQPIRSNFEARDWRADPDNPFSTGIRCANFDEIFRAICLVGLMLQITQVRIAYGGYS